MEPTWMWWIPLVTPAVLEGAKWLANKMGVHKKTIMVGLAPLVGAVIAVFYPGGNIPIDQAAFAGTSGTWLYELVKSAKKDMKGK